MGLPIQPASDTHDQEEADTCHAETTEHPAMEVQMVGVKTVLPGRRQLCRLSGKAKGENTSWLQQKTSLDASPKHKTLEKRGAWTVPRGALEMLLLPLNMELWPARAVQSPHHGTLTPCVTEHRVCVFLPQTSCQNETKCEFLQQGKLRSMAVVCRQVTGGQWHQER